MEKRVSALWGLGDQEVRIQGPRETLVGDPEISVSRLREDVYRRPQVQRSPQGADRFQEPGGPGRLPGLRGRADGSPNQQTPEAEGRWRSPTNEPGHPFPFPPRPGAGRVRRLAQSFLSRLHFKNLTVCRRPSDLPDLRGWRPSRLPESRWEDGTRTAKRPGHHRSLRRGPGNDGKEQFVDVARVRTTVKRWEGMRSLETRGVPRRLNVSSIHIQPFNRRRYGY